LLVGSDKKKKGRAAETEVLNRKVGLNEGGKSKKKGSGNGSPPKGEGIGTSAARVLGFKSTKEKKKKKKKQRNMSLGIGGATGLTLEGSGQTSISSQGNSIQE